MTTFLPVLLSLASMQGYVSLLEKDVHTTSKFAEGFKAEKACPEAKTPEAKAQCFIKAGKKHLDQVKTVSSIMILQAKGVVHILNQSLPEKDKNKHLVDWVLSCAETAPKLSARLSQALKSEGKDSIEHVLTLNETYIHKYLKNTSEGLSKQMDQMPLALEQRLAKVRGSLERGIASKKK